MDELRYWINYLNSQLKYIKNFNWHDCKDELKIQLRIKYSIISHIINLKCPNLNNYQYCSLFNFISSQDLINNNIEDLINNKIELINTLNKK